MKSISTLLLFNLTITGLCYGASDMIPSNRKYLKPGEFESCSVGKFFEAPSELADETGRLNSSLRKAAANHAVMDNLILASKYHLFNIPSMAKAYADLSVTGSASYKNFLKLHENANQRDASLIFKLRNDPELKDFSSDQIQVAINKTLDRSYAVLNAILTGSEVLRMPLGWIAVSGEDDMPHRPVNVMGPKYVQRNLDVNVNGIKLSTRYIVANTKNGPESILTSSREILNTPSVSIDPNTKVILFIHGMDSTVEEANSMIDELEKKGENWTVIAMDMPTSGYTTKLDHFLISPISDIGTPKLLGFNARNTQKTPVLDFMENFIVEFVNELDKSNEIKSKIHAVIGGSMGGSLTLRLGRRDDLDWVKNIVSWSTASAWRGYADGANKFLQVAVSTAWNRAGGNVAYKDELDFTRKNFFYNYFSDAVRVAGITLAPSQPEHWFARRWPCFKDAIKESKIQRQEIYNTNFRTWHWRLAAEQLIYSHRFAPDIKEPRYYQNKKPTLLLCGMLDNFRFTRLCGNIQTFSQYMKNTPGKARFLYNTGHSIHRERPAYFTELMLDFLKVK